MKKYLITGGAGFIGANFIEYLFAQYDRNIFIINADKLTYAGNPENLAAVSERENYCFVKADIADCRAVREIFARYRPEVVVNFAAESHVDRSIEEPQVFARTNILGTQTLLDAALEYPVSKFIQVSTDEVYGSLRTEGRFEENSSLKPRNPYAASKASADLMVQAYGITYGLPVIISRCCNNYGPYQFPEKLIPLVADQVLQGKTVPVYGDGKNMREWIYVRDHCRAIDLLVNEGRAGKVYNIGTGEEKSNIELVKLIIRLLKKMVPADDARSQHINNNLITFVADRKGHDFRYALDSTRIRAELGWQPEMKEFTAGLTLTLKWYLENSEWVRQARERKAVIAAAYEGGC